MNDAERALAYLREHGWLKGEFDDGRPTYEAGPACLMALWSRKGVLGNDAYRVVRDVIAEQYPDRSAGKILGFNDHVDTTFADVERVLEKTALRLEELA